MTLKVPTAFNAYKCAGTWIQQQLTVYIICTTLPYKN